MSLLSILFAVVSAITLSSPDEQTKATIHLSPLTISVTHQGVEMLSESQIGLDLEKNQVTEWKVTSKPSLHKETIEAPVYHRKSIPTSYREMTLSNTNLQLIVRAYNQGIAYRFVYRGKQPIVVRNEQAGFRFPETAQGYFPYVRQEGSIAQQYESGFENFYTHCAVSELKNDQLIFLPVVVQQPNGYSTLIMEADLMNYPGMFLLHDSASNLLQGHYAAVPDSVVQGGKRLIKGKVVTRNNYIAQLQPKQAMPWRIVAVADQDKDLLDVDLVYQLATSKDDNTDWSWVKPGQVAWDWWNNWNITGVPFQAGVNTDTYKYYIDFAAQYGIPYILLDEGWAVKKQIDLRQIVPEINLEELVAYGNQRGVKLILWAGYWAFMWDMENTCKYFSEMGIAGFKVDFMERDDQLMVDFHRRAAQMAAKYHLLIDFHGTYKPTGLQRTYPNVLNFEGVFGLEQLRNPKQVDQVTYDVTFPFIRQACGPVDYTQGAMRNGTQTSFRFNNMEPMSPGTRCRQLAEYVVFFSPLNMLCDAPTMYKKENECTRAITAVPTTWDETKVLDGKIGEYIITARQKGDTWYIGALTNWSERDITIDLSQIRHVADSPLQLDIYRDGRNAHRNANDYVHEQVVTKDSLYTIHLAPGGGCLIVAKPTQTHRLATYNVRYINIKPEKADKGERSWAARREYVLRNVRENKFDIVGMQEVTGNNHDATTGKSQLQDLQEGLPDYTCISYEREDKDYSYNCIFYRTGRYECLHHESFWLSETPEVVSKGWGSNYWRRCIVALMRDKQTNQQFYFCCAHTDFTPIEAGLKQAELLGERLSQLAEDGTPLVLVGDLNFCKKDNPEIYEVYARYFQDSSDSDFPTYQHWTTVGSPTFSGREIDFLFYHHMTPLYRHIVTSHFGRSFSPSDHFPVYVDFLF